MNSDESKSMLLFRAGASICALELAHVGEVMRPLPVEPVVNAPECVHGLSIIRGEPVPVVSLPSILGLPAAPAGRFVIVRAAGRAVALAVESVLGVFHLAPTMFQALPPMVRNAAGALQSVGALDSELLLVLNSASMVPEETWGVLNPGRV